MTRICTPHRAASGPLAVLLLALLCACGAPHSATAAPLAEGYRAIAYVTVPASENWRWVGEDDPPGENPVSGVDVRYVTHINFAFGMLEALQFDPAQPGRPLHEGQVASPDAYVDPATGTARYRATLTGWIEEMGAVVDGGPYLQALVALKSQKPALKVLLSLGGWDSDGFCYMAKTEAGRAEFIESCLALLEEYGLDGIDLDWEYPTNGGWGAIAHCDTCVEDARALLVEFRAALTAQYPAGGKLLTIASGSYQPWVDAATFPALDYMNVMTYDRDSAGGGPQAALDWAATAMDTHAEMVGDTPENRAKINLGVPFYNAGGPHLVPYHQPYSGYVDTTPAILAEKMRWVQAKGYGGAFYWAYSMDVFEQDVEDPADEQVKILQRTVYETLNGEAGA